jgi:CarD family transcriptional regulator
MKGSMVMYETCDYVICRKGGVWRISGIENDHISLFEHEIGTVNVVTKDDNDIVRKISSIETVQEAIERIPFIRSIQAPNAKTRMKLYDEAMSKYDEVEWIKVIKTVYLRQKIMMTLKHSELSYIERAKGYFHGEVSVLMGMPMLEVENYIASIVSQNR